MIKYLVIAASMLAAAVPATAQDLSAFKKVLLPVYTSKPISGLNGATFSTVLRGYSETDVTGRSDPARPLALEDHGDRGGNPRSRRIVPDGESETD